MQTPNESQNSLIIEERITKVNGDFHIKKYAQGKFLGKGGFAKVYIFTNLETNKNLAGKVMPKVNFNRSRSRQKLMTEIRLHKSLSHPNIVKFEHVFEDHENVYILLELCQNQSVNELLKRRKRLTEFEVQCYLIQIVSALKYLHFNRIIHRDLKLGNMFLTDKMQIKLGDFGLAAKLEFDGEKKRTVCGTPNYIAPEILDGNIGHSYEVDIWSVGVIIYTLIIGKPPFETTDIKLTYKKIKENEYSFPDSATISDNAKDLIKRILVTQPEKRLTLDEILLHPFIDHSGPVPSLMPVSTMSTAPSNSYVKQFNSSNNSQRIRISTEPDPIDSSDPTKPLKSFFINTARTNSTPKTPSGNNLQKIDFFKLTPKTTKNEILGSDRFSPSPLSTFANDMMRSKTPNSLITPKVPPVKTFLLTENIEEDQEEHAVEKIEDVKSSARGGLELLLPKDLKKPSNEIDEVRVVKWHDYSSKYGLGYALSNGAIGVFFNDGVKLVSDSEETFELIKRDSNKQDFRETHSFQDHPQEVHKRVLVFNHFKDNLKSAVTNPVKTNSFVYVKKWISTKHAVFFRMNNRVLQVNFKDESVLIMNSDAKRVVFVDTKGVKHVNGLEQASSSDNKDLAKRMKYTEDVLKQIWTVQTDNTTRKEKMTPRDLGINEDLNKQAFNSQPERVI